MAELTRQDKDVIWEHACRIAEASQTTSGFAELVTDVTKAYLELCRDGDAKGAWDAAVDRAMDGLRDTYLNALDEPKETAAESAGGDPEEQPPAEAAKRLLSLTAYWKRIAANKFRSAAEEETPFGRRFVQHGAICYFNCAAQLEGLVESWKGRRGIG
jgi:hypothetical protein